MSSGLKCFLPCRKGSERVPRKNVKPFLNFQHGLFELKINQLIESKRIDEIVVSTNDEEIIEFVKASNNAKVKIHKRDEYLSSSQTSTDDLVNHAAELIPEGHILWTHVTSPFVTARHYDNIIESYFSKLELGYDSLMSATPIFGFLWDQKDAINYDRTIEKWPRTQTLNQVNEINSAAFIASSSIYKIEKDRIGKKPYLYSLDKLVSHDIDWLEDFILAECLAEKKLVQL